MPLPVKRKPKKKSPRLFLGEWVARLGRKPVEVALHVDVSESYLSEMISGKKVPSVGVLMAISDFLGIAVDDLRRPPPPRLAVEAVERLAPNQLAALGQLLNQIKKPPTK